MRNRPWHVRSLLSWITRFLPAWLKRKAGWRGALLFILACIYWQVSERLNAQQISWALSYADAQVGLYIGLDPEGTMSVRMPDGDYDVYRNSAAKLMNLDLEWRLLCNAIERGLKFALLFIFVLLGWSVGNGIIEKQYRERERVREKIERQAALIKEYEKAQFERSKWVPNTLVELQEPPPQKEFEFPDIELLTDLIDAQENSVSDSHLEREEQSDEPPIAKPLRQPGRIYRDDD